MSWFVDNSLTWFEQQCVNIIKIGEVPKHVAFIMDGNRRFAKKAHVKTVIGHSNGFDKLVKTLDWCKKLGIIEVTVYAFSIDNFKRSKEEVDGLLDLAREKFERLLQDKDKIMENGVCIRIIGNLSYLNPEMRKLIAEIMLLSENNTKCFWNIAISYTSRDEITNSIKCIKDGVNAGLLDITDIDEQLISNCLYTNKSPDPDLLVRTSGEMRFSDFLLWQISCTQVCFSNALWPELSIWHFLAVVFMYQSNFSYMLSVKKAKDAIQNNNNSIQNNPRVTKFLEHVEEHRRNQLKNYLNVS